MAKSPLKDKDFIPDDETPAEDPRIAMASLSRDPRGAQEAEPLPRDVLVRPVVGLGARFCIGEVTVCGVYLAQNPLMGLVGVGDKVGAYLDKDMKLSQRLARPLRDDAEEGAAALDRSAARDPR